MKYTKEFLESLVKQSLNMWEVVEKAGVKRQEGNYRYISKLVKKYKIPKDHFINQRGKNVRSIPLEEYLVKGKFLTINGNILKKKLFKAGLKENKCEKCGLGDIWNNEKISLILDHIDGDRENNLLENLRILCPNCNATLETHCGKNKLRSRAEASSERS